MLRMVSEQVDRRVYERTAELQIFFSISKYDLVKLHYIGKESYL